MIFWFGGYVRIGVDVFFVENIRLEILEIISIFEEVKIIIYVLK